MKGKVKHVFFDLDRTLWDFDRNSEEVIRELLQEYNVLKNCNTTFEEFHSTYKLVNDELWSLYRENKISKDKLRSSRFSNTMRHFGFENPELGKKMEENYIQRSPLKRNLLPGAIELLGTLKVKYKLNIITNGFLEVQNIKLKNSGLRSYFTNVIISEEIGINKPDKRIFEYALNVSGALADQSVMIGDDLEADVKGAESAGLMAIFLNSNGETKGEKIYKNEINSLVEIENYL